MRKSPMACKQEERREEFVHAYNFSEMGEDELSTAIITAVARTIDVEPMELTNPLYDTIDANEIHHTLAPSDDADHDSTFVMFTYYHCRVSVWSDGTILVREPESSAPNGVESP